MLDFSWFQRTLCMPPFSSKIQFCELNLQSPYPPYGNGKRTLDHGTGHWIHMIWYDFKQTGLCSRSSWSLTSDFLVFHIKFTFLCTGPPFSNQFKQFQKFMFFQIISINFKNSHFFSRKAFLGECGGRSTKLKNENFAKSQNWKISKVWPWPYTHTILPCLISHQVLEMLDFPWFQRSLFM